MVFGFIRKKAGEMISTSRLRSLVERHPWLRPVLLQVNFDLAHPVTEDNHLYIQYIQNDPDAKLEVGEEIAEKICAVAEGGDHLRAARGWLVELCGAYAPLQILFVQQPEDIEEQLRHPCLTGVPHLLVDILEKCYPEDIQQNGGVDEAYEVLRVRSLKTHYLLTIANLLCYEIGEDKKIAAQLMPSLLASSAVEYRRKVGAKVPCDPTRIRNEATMLSMNAKNMVDDITRNVRPARPYNDWKPDYA